MSTLFLLILIILDVDGARHPTQTYSEIAVFGSLPPKPISYSEFCPKPNCPPPNCSEYKCNNAFLHDLLNHLEIRPFEDIRYPGLTNRTFGKQFHALCDS